MNANGIVSKIAKLAASKAAAFTYAVAVGVAGNLAFNFVQQHHPPAPPVLTAPMATPPAGAGKPAAPAAEASAPLPISPGLAEKPRGGKPEAERPSRAALPPEKPPVPEAARHPEAEITRLPEAPSASPLPSPDSLPVPRLKPAALIPAEPGRPPAAAPAPAATAALPPDSHRPPPPETEHPAEPAASAPLPPFGQPIDVAPLPLPPAEAATSPAEVHRDEAGPKATEASIRRAVPARPASDHDGQANSLELSDVWHPGRAVAKGLHWAGDQLPSIGGDDPPPGPGPAHLPAVTRPIPLLPSPEPGRADAKPPGPLSPERPGPGSGGLY